VLCETVEEVGEGEDVGVGVDPVGVSSVASSGSIGEEKDGLRKRLTMALHVKGLGS
jgi:hypothetical protein